MAGELVCSGSNAEEILTIAAEMRDSPHTPHVHSSESKILGPIFGKLTFLLYLELFFEPVAKKEPGKAQSGLVR